MKKNTGLAMLAYVLFFLPLLTEQKDDSFVKFHTKQGFVLFVTGCVCMFISYMPIFYWLAWLLGVAILVLLIIGLINAAGGKEKELPFIGQFADKVNFL